MASPDRPVARQKRSRKRRAPWGSISRDQIVEAATAMVRRGDFEQMTMRSLADDLSVTPMALYRHVRDKDDLLDEVADHFLRGSWRPRRTTTDWRAWITEAANRLRRLLVEEPAVLYVYLRHPVVTPAAIARMEAMIEVLRSADLDEQAAIDAYATVHVYTIGFATLEASRNRWVASDDSAGALSKEFAAFTKPERFSRGLRYLLDGIDPERQSTSVHERTSVSNGGL